MKKYRTIVADPPWPLKWESKPRIRKGGKWGEAKERLTTPSMNYGTMSVDEIAGLPVEAIVSDDAHLFMWTFDQFVIDGSSTAVAQAWGFTPRRFLVWKKRGFGMGRFPRPQHELVLICTRGNLPFGGPRDIGSVQEWPNLYEKRGRSVAKVHSAKPDAFLDLVEQASPGPYVELFARRARFGWDYWGNESLGTAEMPSAAA